ncbi:MAG: hypothetical protein J6J44_00540 [Lachnospiraceae bacterium]|nr:hypothetical protein [Lachnospiraceae bacterium]
MVLVAGAETSSGEETGSVIGWAVPVGASVGAVVGSVVGAAVSTVIGVLVGAFVGAVVGSAVGAVSCIGVGEFSPAFTLSVAPQAVRPQSIVAVSKSANNFFFIIVQSSFLKLICFPCH